MFIPLIGKSLEAMTDAERAGSLRFPGFLVEVGGVDEYHAALFTESRNSPSCPNENQCFVSNESLEYLRLHQHYEASRACPESRR